MQAHAEVVVVSDDEDVAMDLASGSISAGMADAEQHVAVQSLVPVIKSKNRRSSAMVRSTNGRKLVSEKKRAAGLTQSPDSPFNLFRLARDNVRAMLSIKSPFVSKTTYEGRLFWKSCREEYAR